MDSRRALGGGDRWPCTGGAAGHKKGAEGARTRVDILDGGSIPAVPDNSRTMRHRWRSAFVAALALLALACSQRFEWREVRTGDGAVASLPGRAQSVMREIDVAGQRVSMTMWSTGVGPTMFAVGSARLPAPLAADPAGRAQVIGYFRDGLVRNIGGTVTSSAAAPLPLPPGGARKLLASEAVEASGGPAQDGRKSRLAARFFIVDDQFFQVVALGAEGEIPPEVLETFFTSFRLAP